MEGFRYVDIFATKGIEYLLVIGFLVALVIFWKFLSTPVGARLELKVAERRVPALSKWFLVPEGLYYHPGHTWAMPEGDDVVKVGLDDFAGKLIGKPSSIGLPQIGSRIEQGERGWNLQVDSKSIPMLSPVSGEVLAVNEEALNSPEVFIQDPYEKGWLMKIRVPKIKSNLKNLLSARLAGVWMEETVNNLRERMGGHLGLVYQDGGLPVSGIARSLSPDRWDEIAMEFFLTK